MKPSLHRIVSSEPFVAVLLIGSGIAFSVLSCDARPLPDPEDVASVIVPMEDGEGYASPRVHEICAEAVKLPLVERKAYIEKVLATPNLLSPSDAARLRRAGWLMRLPQDR